MDEIKSDVIAWAIGIAFTLLCTAGAWLFRELRSKVQSETVTKLFQQLDTLATMVVLELEQTIVQKAKQEAANGKLPADIAIEVKNLAVSRMLAIINDMNHPIRKALLGVFNESKMVIGTLIEAKVRAIRMAQVGRGLKS